MDWPDHGAEKIFDAFLADQSSEDLLLLQQTIATAFSVAYEKGCAGKSPEIVMGRR
jgi:hypothetical protein